jgi:hypothetical protein
VSKLGSGTVTSLPSGISCGAGCAGAAAAYSLGTSVALAAVPADGFAFAGWSGDPDCVDSAVTMTNDLTCTARFLPTFVLTISKMGNGVVTSFPAGIACGQDCQETYDSGTQVALTATPDPGFGFAGWNGSADCEDGIVTMTAARTCQALFTVPLTLTVAKVGSGRGRVTSLPCRDRLSPRVRRRRRRISARRQRGFGRGAGAGLSFFRVRGRSWMCRRRGHPGRGHGMHRPLLLTSGRRGQCGCERGQFQSRAHARRSRPTGGSLSSSQRPRT